MPGSLMLESHTGRLTLKLKAIQDPPLGKAGQVVWFLINPPAVQHQSAASSEMTGFLVLTLCAYQTSLLPISSMLLGVSASSELEPALAFHWGTLSNQNSSLRNLHPESFKVTVDSFVRGVF
jgi:hypothetical protein|tara:strand:- start:132 stop:497 length:366 start_codon:yes stop_codon:yes gene_type:complete